MGETMYILSNVMGNLGTSQWDGEKAIFIGMGERSYKQWGNENGKTSYFFHEK